MKIEAGKYYRTRDGRKVGPMVKRRSSESTWTDDEYPWNEGKATSGRWSYSGEDGCAMAHVKLADSDLIAEWQDEPEYETGKWYGWNGGECPVHPDTVVTCMWQDKDGFFDGDTYMAKKFAWHDLDAFRIIKPYEEPREFWIDPMNMRAYREKPAGPDDHFCHVVRQDT